MNRARKFAIGWLLILLGCARVVGAPAASDLSGQPIYRIMCAGDEITSGATNSFTYQYPLWEKLLTAGYLVEFVGSHKTDSRIGPLKNEAYPGQTAEFLAAKAIESFRKQPADIVLLDAGHSHTAAEQPAPGIIAADEAMIRAFREANPNVVVLLAQTVPSGKPEYSYIPALNKGLAQLGHKLNTASQPVMPVNLAAGFDWKKDTAGDETLPDARGVEKIAARWFATLTKILEPPKQSYHPQIVVYKKASGADLTLHIFKPAKKIPGPHPAIVFFFGGGWKVGTPIQFYAECAHFAEKGFVAISADYRIETVEHTTPFESVADGKSAIRWIRSHAGELNIDPRRIVGAGASAGGQVAAAAATVKGLDEPGEDTNVSARPDALILWYAVIDNGPGGYGHERIKDRYREISPLQNLDGDPPPTLFFLGTKDRLVPTATAAAFKARIDKLGGRCELVLFESAPHGFGDYRKGDNELRRKTISAADDFLTSLNFMPVTERSR